jgi:hypothetical protein
MMMLAPRWVGNQPLLLMLVVLLPMKWIVGTVVVHHPVPRRSTAGWSCHNLPLLCFLVGSDCIFCDDDITEKLWE